MTKRKAMVIIDPQNCFTDIDGAPLPVIGASDDLARLADYLDQYGQEYERIYISLDTHRPDHISHAVRWVDQEGNHPNPFTIITAEEYQQGKWRAANPADQVWQGEYLRRLERPHCIWPVHGQKGTWEWRVNSTLVSVTAPGCANQAGVVLRDRVTFIEKGMHREVEQFGIFGADVQYPGALETYLNQRLIDEINQFDQIDWVGEASSHCVMDSVNQFLSNIDRSDWSKVRLFRDAMSPVPQPPGGPDFPALAEDWFSQLQNDGVAVELIVSQ